MSNTDQTPLIQILEQQVQYLYMEVKKSNRHFWPALLNPRGHLKAQPQAFSHGSLEQMQLVLKNNIDAWTETPGAVDVIKELLDKEH